jgi:hypothetical protein
VRGGWRVGEVGRRSEQDHVTNVNCSGVGYSQRIDIPEVLAWIESFLW